MTARGLAQLYGGRHDRNTYEIRDFLTRTVVQYEWTPIDSDAECFDALGTTLASARLPMLVLPDGAQLVEPSLEQIARSLGWISEPHVSTYDLAIYGAGPAGLSAAVYAASEGLRVVLVEREAVGGQAGSSSLIENYLGFPSGVRGAELMERARQQAVAFGAELLLMRQKIRGEIRQHGSRSAFSDGTQIAATAVIAATGVAWRRLGLENEDRFLGAGVYYGAGTSEALACVGEEVFIVGGANSAGQAAMNLATHASRVTLVVRGPSLSSTMSSYLASRIAQEPKVRVLTDTRIVELHGGEELESIVLENGRGEREECPTGRVFVCIGGVPDTHWTTHTSIVCDPRGFLMTGPDLTPELLDGRWDLDRSPFHLETSVPGTFAAGDVRSGSVKRVASAVGEGAMAVTLVHRYLSETFGTEGTLGAPPPPLFDDFARPVA
ncbi:NAD(P)/FAD-dependent oxidoreductase [Microbacterium sp. JZ31]|uniref:NAD(P)/FAD-dependent oxidoreductase n=1 Tax=Microbacterium sp. JZ31 TaxID=1906274 RepID=UPI00193169C7|nr:NAD(P)/FAD-dependent oxidoreductase [Microbacterium sp. JZ31]